MAFFENCVERATALAATCGWLAFGGGLEAAVGVAIGGAGLATVMSDAMRRHGPESEKALATIRSRVREGLERYASAEGWYVNADLEAADQAMERALAASFLDRRSLAESARSAAGFPSAAAKIVLSKLAEAEPSTFGEHGSQIAKDYAATVIKTALQAAIENESYFKNLQPHLMMEALRGIGSIEEKVDEIQDGMASIQSTLLEISRKLRSSDPPRSVDLIRVELIINDRGEAIIMHNQEFPYPLDRVEYSTVSRRMKLVIAGDFEKDFGIAVHPELAKFLGPEKSDKILIVLMDDQTGKPIEGDYFPLKFSD